MRPRGRSRYFRPASRNSLRRAASRYVAGLLNSPQFRALAYVLAMPKGGFPYKQYVQWNIAVLPFISMDAEQALTRRIADAVQSGIEQGLLSTPDFANQIDSLVGELFGFTHAETESFRRFIDFLMGKVTKWTG